MRLRHSLCRLFNGIHSYIALEKVQLTSADVANADGCAAAAAAAEGRGAGADAAL